MKIFFKPTMLLFWLLASVSLHAQIVPRTWNFEDPCSDYSNSLYNGCIPFATSGSGSPDTESPRNTLPAIQGKRDVLMRANHVFCPNNGGVQQFHSETTLLSYSFSPGITYRMKFWIRGKVSNKFRMEVILVNNMPNTGGSVCHQDCTCTTDLLPNIPAVSQQLASYTPTEITTVWSEQEICFTPTQSFNQVWFRPHAQSNDATSSVFNFVCLDAVSITDPCSQPNYGIDLCKTPEGSVVVTINEPPIDKSEWTLLPDPRCLGYWDFFSPYTPIPINWIGVNSFSLPSNSGCYVLTRFQWNACCPLNPFVFQSYPINTNAYIDYCDLEHCYNWKLDKYDNGPCTSPTFYVLGTDPTFDAGNATFTFSVNNIMQQSGDAYLFDMDPELYSFLPDGTHTTCVTVAQPTCPPITQCIDFDKRCNHGGGDRSGSNGFSVSNPNADFIYLKGQPDEGTAELYSMQGQLVREFTLNGQDKLEIHDVINGQYFLRINSKALVTTSKIIIQK